MSDSLGGSLLDQMSGAGEAPEGSGRNASPARTDRQLEQQLEWVTKAQRRIDELKTRVRAALETGDKEGMQQAGEGQRLISELNERLELLQMDLRAARRQRPQDPTLDWLSGELLMLVGGETEQILPHLQRAIAGGVKRPRAFATLAKVQLAANQFQPSYESALKALEMDNHSRDGWDAFEQVGFSLEKFSEVVARLDQAFPRQKPLWATAIRSRAEDLLAGWRVEQRLRRAEQKADDLPRVRLWIEHRRFARAPDESSLPKTETTGSGQVDLELFEDQAPAAVANFIHLVEQGYYDGTLFHLVEAPHLVVGGDPATKNADPSDDGMGGPGYVIPDEFNSPKARKIFRGSLCMVSRGPHTSGSQFFITVAPMPDFDGHFTVFGRVIRGQSVVDRITPGRTNLKLGRFGKAMPGDVVVSAKVTRKRPHEYRVIKYSP